MEPVPTAAPAPPIANIHIKPERDEAEERKEAEEKKAAEDKKAEEKAKKRKSKDGDGGAKVPKPAKIKAPKREDDGSGRKKKVVTVKRLLLNDAVAHADSMDGWSEARKQAFKLIDTNPNAYYYRFNAPGEPQRNGAFTPEERALFLKLYSEWLARNPDGNIQWGMFSKEMPGRVGYQCTNFYRKLLAEGALKDPNYYTDAQGVLRHKSYAQHHANKDAPEAADAKSSAASQRPKRKRKAREESPEPDDFSDEDEEEEAPELSDEEEGEGGKKRNRSKSKADAADSADSGDEAVLSPRPAKAGGKTARHTEREAQKEKRRTETYVPPNVVISTKGEALAQVALLCRECAASGPHAEFLFCVDCGDTCHRHCLSMDVKLTEETRFLWRCADCKVCDSCHKGQDEEKMLVCDQCDRGFHIYCLSPPLAHIPDGRWLCSHCVQCKSCGTRSSDQWLVDFQYCGHCGDLYLRNNFCPSCEKCYEEDDVTSKMIQCDACARWVHASCDGIDDAAYQAMTESEVDVPYKCPKCRARMAKVGTTTNAPPAAPAAPAAPLPPPPPPALRHWNDAYGKAVPFFTDDAHRERRLCLFCGQEGDQFSRLIPTRLDQWAHAHCVVWAPEVGVDERTGMLRNFNNASARAKSALCASCNQPGASLACAYARCTLSYHFPCARGAECLFLDNRQMFCRTHVQHRPAGVPPLVTFALPEKVSVPRLKPKNKSQSKKADPLAWRSGAVTVASLGALSARDGFHTRDAFFPIGFRSLRWAWSTTHIGQRTLYEFRIAADGNRPRFTLCDVAAPEAVAWSGASVATLWKQMTGAVNALRIAAGDRQSISGLSQLPATFYFGLTQAWVETQLEEMEHAKDCVLYVFKHNAAYMKPSEDAAVEEVSRNPTGCARSEGLLLADLRARKPRKTGKVVGQSGASTRAPILAKIRGTGAQFDIIDMPIGTRYRLMKGRVKHLRVARSSIHDLGVYSRVPLKAGDVIVEYVGELIRPIIADKREKMYDSRGIGCYMFRLDEKLIIDATMCGNLARYINHSCGPNAFSDVVEIGGQKKIVIIAKKDISPEEEITYDYQFELEDNKIPCGCGAPNCRKFIN